MTKRGVLRRQPEVAGQRQLAASAQGVAVEGRDRGPGDGGQRVQGAPEAASDLGRPLRPAELLDVGAGGEDALPAPHHHGARRLAAELTRRRRQLAQQLHGQRVHLGPVEAHQGDPVGPALEGDERVGHHPPSPDGLKMRSAAA